MTLPKVSEMLGADNTDHGFKLCMGHSLKNCIWWSLWVTPSSEYSVIFHDSLMRSYVCSFMGLFCMSPKSCVYHLLKNKMKCISGPGRRLKPIVDMYFSLMILKELFWGGILVKDLFLKVSGISCFSDAEELVFGQMSEDGYICRFVQWKL